MRNILILIFYTLFLFSMLYSKDTKYGVGIILGNPEGLSFEIDRFSLKDKKSDSISMAINFNTKEEYFYFHIDYLIKDHKFIQKKDLTGELPFYWGIGLKLESKNYISMIENIFGIRFILGAEYRFEEIPFTIFTILAPVIDFSPKTSISLAPSLGVRYLFK